MRLLCLGLLLVIMHLSFKWSWPHSSVRDVSRAAKTISEAQINQRRYQACCSASEVEINSHFVNLNHWKLEDLVLKVRSFSEQLFSTLGVKAVYCYYMKCWSVIIWYLQTPAGLAESFSISAKINRKHKDFSLCADVYVWQEARPRFKKKQNSLK